MSSTRHDPVPSAVEQYGSPRTRADRYRSLDGLRGIAALVVVVHHCALVVPALDDANGRRVDPVGPARWVTYSPLHLVWAGHEAVVVFFVLSGFVLTLPVLASRTTWPSYYPKRMVRLYLPAWAGMAVGALLALTFWRGGVPGQSAWLTDYGRRTNPVEVLEDVVSLSGHSRLDGVVWSLRWEVAFSLLLPVYVVAAVRLRRWQLAKVAVLAGLVAAGSVFPSGFLIYLPMFAVGVIMAVEREGLHRLARRVRRPAWAALVALGGLLLVASWLPVGLPNSDLPALAGASVLLFAFLEHDGCRRVAELASCQWLGSRSYSLYLVHVPVVVSVATLLGPSWAGLVACVAVPTSLSLAELMHRYVEQPSCRLASRAGRVAAGAVA